MWKSTLRGDPEGEGQVPLSSVKNVTRAIQNFHHQDIMDKDREEGLAKGDPGKVGRMSEQGILFKGNEIEGITRKYKDLFANRMNKLQDENKNARFQRSVQKNSLGEQYNYSPSYSNKSKRLAFQKQASITGNTNLKPEDRFMYQAQESQLLKQELQRQEDVKISQELTLKPKVSRASKYLAEQKKDPKFDNQWDYLHNDATNKNKNLRQDKRTDERELEKDPNAYTFQPNPDRQGAKVRPPMPEELSTQRRSLARGSIVPGAAGSEAFQINVNIKGQKRVITADTNSNPQETAQAFIDKYGIDQNYHQTLSDLIADQQRQIFAKQSPRK